MWKWTQINHLKLIILDCESLNQKYIDFPYQHLLGVDVLKIESLDIDKNIDLDALIANFLIMAQCQSYEAIVISGDMTWLKKVMSYRIGTLFVGHLQQKDLKYMPDFVVDSIDSLVDVLSEKDKGYSGEVLTFENKKGSLLSCQTEIVSDDGKKYLTQFYNLDAIIAVGYRVNSKKATRFRQWATKTLKEYIMKGFVLNDEMLKNGKPFGKDYFDELLERIKEIRASERRFYQKITDIYAQCSYDYDPKSNITDLFFKTVQNKLLFAVTQHTAPELVADRADSEKEHMGLTTWKNAPNGKVLQSDALVSKNYLTKEELSSLNDIVSMYLDYAENQAKRNRLMSMQDWKNKLDAFLQFNEYDILNHTGKVSREVADQLAITEYKKFRVKQDKTYLSDFDKLSAKYLKSNQKSR